MRIKSFLYPFVISIMIMGLLMFFLYDFNISFIYLSNVLFFMGISFFFPGLISISGASQVFDSSAYLTRRTFTKNPENDFKTFNDYKAHKQLQRTTRSTQKRGFPLFVLGTGYILLSLIIGFVA